MYIESVPNFIWSHTVPRMSVRAYLNMLQLPKKTIKGCRNSLSTCVYKPDPFSFTCTFP